MMYFRPIITLCVNYLLCSHRVGSLQVHSSLTNRTLSNEDLSSLIAKFLDRFKKSYLKEHEPRQVTVIGPSTKYLDQAQPLFESYPSIVCSTESEECPYSEDLSSGNFAVVFLRDLNEVTVGKNIKSLSSCGAKCKILIISEGIIDIAKIRLLFAIAARHNLGNVEFAHFGKNVAKLYTRAVASDCTSIEIRLSLVWTPGVSLNSIHTQTFASRNLNGCPISVSTSSFEPKMILQNDSHGSLTISGGREGELVLALAKTLNFTLALRSPSATERLKYSRKASIVNDVVSGIADIGIGRLRPTNDLDQDLVHSVMYDDECITWGVPRIMEWPNNVVSVEFSPRVWALVALVFVMGCATGYSFEKIYSPRTGTCQTRIGFASVVLDVVAIHLGSPAAGVPTSGGGRFALITFLCYATVLTTAYKTSLASILTTERGTPTIVDVAGIVRANLSLGGSRYDFNMLKDQVNYSVSNSKLVERFVVNNNDSETMRRLKFNKDFAFLARGSSLHDEKQKSVRDNKALNFDVFDRCVLAYHTVLVIRKASFLLEPVNLVIRRLSESGILEHWDVDKFDSDRVLERRNADKFFEERAGRKFQTIFVLYSCCIALCLLVFFIELIIPKSKSQKMSTC